MRLPPAVVQFLGVVNSESTDVLCNRDRAVQRGSLAFPSWRASKAWSAGNHDYQLRLNMGGIDHFTTEHLATAAGLLG